MTHTEYTDEQGNLVCDECGIITRAEYRKKRVVIATSPGTV
jgi:hypothetical protein